MAPEVHDAAGRRLQVTGTDRAGLMRLMAALPKPGIDEELILRPDGDEPLAMWRKSGEPPRAFVLDGDAAKELLPEDDPSLPAAKRFGKKSRMIRALEPSLGAVEEPRLVAWRPAKRAVVRVRRGEEALFVKFLDKKTYRRAAKVFAALPEPVLPMRFARATTLIDDECAYVATAAPGVCLRDILARGETPPWDLLDRSIRALAATPTHDEMPTIDFTTARDAGVRMLQKASVLLPELADRAQRLESVAAPSTTRSGFVHGDFHDRQIFFTKDSASLIDLETVGRGDPTFDLVNMAEQLRLRSLQQAGADDATGTALLDRHGVDADVRARWGVSVRARLCGVYALRPKWDALMRRLLAEVDGMLANLA